MLDRQLHEFKISYKLNGEVCMEWVEGINLRHAKEKIEMKHEDATDLMDWTNEKEEDFRNYLEKIEITKKSKETRITQKATED